MTPQHSIGPYDFKYTDDGDKVPPNITITFYPELQLHPARYMYENSDPPFQHQFGKGKHMMSALYIALDIHVFCNVCAKILLFTNNIR